jgi:hypothetical protein
MADRHRLHALQTVLMALSLTLVLLAAHTLHRLNLQPPSPAAAIPAATSAAAVTTRCAQVPDQGEAREVAERA